MQERYLEKGEAFDLIAELDELHTRIILTTAFGLQNVADLNLPFIDNGVTKMRPLGNVLRDLFLYIAFRGMRTEIAFVPYLVFFYYTKKDRECLQNVRTCREFCNKLVLERKLEMQKPGYIKHSQGDLLSTLIEDEEGFAENNEVLIDECITFFLAGSQTVKAASANIIQHITQRDDIRAKLF